MSSPAGPLVVPALRRVLRHRCPHCGEGPLFTRYARLAPGCPECGWVYRRESGASTGAMYVSAGATQGFAVLVMLALWFLTDWSLALSLTVGGTSVLVFCYLFLPYSMALWAAVEYLTDVHNGEPWTRGPSP